MKDKLKRILPDSLKKILINAGIGGLSLFRRATRFFRQSENPKKTFHNAEKEKRIVVFFNEIPKPDRDSGSVRMTAILEALNDFANVILVYIHRRKTDEIYEKRLAENGIESVWIADFQTRFKTDDYDAAILCYPKVADLIYPKIKKHFPKAKIIYDTVDVHFVRLRREYELTGGGNFLKDSENFRRIETQMARKADQIWCVTGDDEKHIRELFAEAKTEIIPNIHRLENRGKNFADRRDLFFIGSFNHRPNTDAVKFFAKEIFPRVSEKLPDVKFRVAGNNPPDEILALDSENVKIEGFVEDVAPFFESCRVFVAPLRYGAGMKGKIGQAFSYGLPTVTTKVGAEGMRLTHETDVLIADDAEKFASEVVRLYQTEELWRKLSDNSYQYIEENFTLEIIRRKILAAVSKISNEHEKLV